MNTLYNGWTESEEHARARLERLYREHLAIVSAKEQQAEKQEEPAHEHTDSHYNHLPA